MSSLNVIALISGGKDSFFSILHCLESGHRVVALANLYPPSPSSLLKEGDTQNAEIEDEEHDLNSFMYQTVGHAIIPLYEKALGIPLYRQEIIGGALQTGTTYSHFDNGTFEGEDETESLIPLLNTILAKHPTANALSTGAILSTYQRTRVESVALRLDLTPLAYLWKYPILPPSTQTSLLEDMQDVSFDARIVKVASGGLDESFLLQNVASETVFRRVERAIKRFGTDGDGAVIGEGGEFETIVLDGPAELFKGRIVVPDGGRRIVREGGGAAWLDLKGAEVVMKSHEDFADKHCRVPDLLDPRFNEVFNMLVDDKGNSSSANSTKLARNSGVGLPDFKLSPLEDTQGDIIHWTVSADNSLAGSSISEEASSLIEEIRSRLAQSSLMPTHIISTTIVLRSMQDFATINKIYGTLFPKPNPPSRVTISCGSSLPPNINVVIHLRIHNLSEPSPAKKALHVQSRSYWAPANIGPYSQVILIPTGAPEDGRNQAWTASIAGQIPLVPQSMTLPSAKHLDEYGISRDDVLGEFKLQAVLSLQHLWRIGQDTEVGWWTSVAAYLPRGSPEGVATRAVIAGKAWAYLHRRISEAEDEAGDARDLWEEKHYAGMGSHGAIKGQRKLPDWEMVGSGAAEVNPISPFFAIEVEELPRESGIEWHAHSGIVGGLVKLYHHERAGCWTLHVCALAETVQVLVLVEHTKSAVEAKRSLNDALEVFGVDLPMTWRSHTSYLDVSVEGIQSEQIFGGVIPCRSIWNAAGKRLVAALLFEARKATK